MNLTVVRMDGALKREVWRFWLYVDGGQIRVQSWIFESRPSKRHRKWTTHGRWDTIDRRRNTIDKPPVPADVVAEARRYFAEAVAALRVVVP